ncbi:MAG: hypothetical protein AB7F25_09025 [Deferribacterales bacterium]
MVTNTPDMQSLFVEDKIALLNRLSAFYRMSEFFFALNRDTVRTANDHDITVVSLDKKPENVGLAADKIKEICEKLKLLDVISTDNGNIVRKKNLLRQKLLRLTQNISENKNNL